VEVQDPEATGFGATFVSATVDISTTHPEAPLAAPPDGEPVEETDLYGPDGLFHGPTFQVVTSLDRLGDETASATLRSPGAGIVGRDGSPAIDAALLDGPGQVLALWLARRRTDRHDVFPVRLARLDLYREADPRPRSYTCTARVRAVDDHRLVSDFDIIEDGRVVAAFRGWEDVRIGLPDDLRAMLARPDESWLSTAWDPPPGIATTDVRGRRVRLPAHLAAESGGLWLDVLARCVLADDERGQWRALAGAQPGRRLEWLAGRIAAKEAVRDLQDRSSADADVSILVDERGAPVVHEGLGSVPAPLVSIAHSAGEAVAVSVSADAAGGIGVDLQPIDTVPAGVEAEAFGAGERHLLDAVRAVDRAALAARIWTAKEAVAKATGDGLTLRPADAPLTTQEPDPGRQGPVAFAPVDRTDAQTWTDLDAGVAYAMCLLPAAPNGGPRGH
jgi:phosphopantetheinyl transferase